MDKDEEMTLTELFCGPEWSAWKSLYLIGTIALDAIAKQIIGDELYLARRSMYPNT